MDYSKVRLEYPAFCFVADKKVFFFLFLLTLLQKNFLFVGGQNLFLLYNESSCKLRSLLFFGANVYFALFSPVENMFISYLLIFIYFPKR